MLFCFVKKQEAQNLVNNGSFENFADCINGQIYNATGWCGIGTPSFGLMTTCQTDPLYSVPHQLFSWFDSYQIPRTGNAYGFYEIYNMNEPDYNYYQGCAQTNLKQTLVNGKSYCVTYYVNCFNNSQYTVDKLGAYLTSTPFNCVSTSTTQIKGLYTPQVYSPAGFQLVDTLGWMEISGVITATGTEDYIIIGDFFLEAQHSIVKTYPSNVNGVAEYYVDDVSVEEVQLAKCKNDTSICPNDSVVIGNNVSEATAYSWLPNLGLSCNTCANPKASPNTTTTYTLTKTQCKAITTASITVTVKTDCTPKVILNEIPNVFTPNGDGINDTFNFNIVGASDVSFVIYNRWGNLIQLVTSRASVTNVLWDGRTTSGIECSDGMYFYTLEYKDAKGDTQKKNGYVSLFR